LVIILEGSGKFSEGDTSLPYRAGQAWFLPASLPATYLQPAEQTSLLRVYVPDRDLLHRQLRSQGFNERAVSQVLLG
jgi:hypothetical protein